MAIAQTSVSNTATVTPPTGFTNPGTSCETNGGVFNSSTGACSATDEDPVVRVTVAKSADPASGTAVAIGQTIQYTLTATVSNGATVEPVEFTDTLGNGLTIVSSSLSAGCTVSGQTITCTLPTGSSVGTHTFTYSATVAAGASGSVTNEVTGGSACTTAGACTTEHPLIDATDDDFGTVNGAEGGDAGNAFDNDTLGGSPVDASEITATVLTPATPINGGSVPTLNTTTGVVTVPAGTPAGSYTIEYQICDKDNPSSCDTATITVEVTAAPIDAVDDSFPDVDGSTGGDVGNAYDNDTLNGEPVDPSKISGTVLTPATPINGGSVPTLNTTTGVVTVPEGTPAGTYTIEYQICEKTNPDNCDTATITVEVTAAPIDAVDDSFPDVNGSTGGDVGNAYDNDTLNGEPVDPSEISGTVLTPATPINGGSVPTLNTTTGVVTVPEGTPAGTYTIEYQICEKTNPDNCDTATITVEVTAAPIDAVDDSFPGVDGSTGGDVGNAYDNDTLNGEPVDPSKISGTVLTPATPINGGSVPTLNTTTGVVTVPEGTPAGTYTIEYQICEKTNPDNCDTATITVEVTAAPIDAVDDSFPGVDGSTGGDVGNAYDNDTLNGEPVDPSKISGTVLTPATPINGGSVPTLNTTTGVVTVPEGTPAGTYTIEYQICEKTNPDNCDTATITVEVTAAPIDAVDDSFPGVDGSTGGDVGNAYDNDTLNGEPVDPSKISGTVLTPATPINGGSVPTLNTTTGVVTVPEGTPAGTYTIEYQICEKTNPDNCDTATITVEVTAAPIDAVDDSFPGVDGSTGGDVGNAYDNDTLNGEPVDPSKISGTVLTPATPINGGSVPTLNTTTGVVTVPEGTPAGTYTIEYQICEKTNPDNCDTATITVEVTAAPIDAVDDSFPGVDGSTGGDVGNAYDNDTLNGEPVDPSKISGTVLTPATPINGGSVPTLNTTTGVVTVPEGTPAGTYTIEYQICEKTNPDNCDTATITVEVTAAPIDAVNDDFGPISGTEGGNAGNAFDNDTLNGEPVDASEITATVLTPATPINGGSVPVLDPATGEVTVPAGTPAGSYTIEYQICETLNPTNCDTATITVEVTAAPIDAVSDDFGPISGTEGGNAGNAFDNDTLNGEPVDASEITATVLTPATPINGGSVPVLDPATGEVTVPASTPAGSYTIEYQICETLNPTNCDTATVTVEVTAAPIDAVDDSFGMVNGADGGNAGNAFNNDTLNGEPVDASEITATVLTPATPINGGSVPTLDTTTGVVTVPEGTPAGTYTIEYQICEKTNPDNCDTATITVEVTAAPIDAVNDDFGPISGTEGGNAGNAFDNDTLNGEPVDASEITATVLTPATPINGGSVPVLDPATGEVTVPAGTPAGSYTIEYQICETLNPTNCDTATITVEVTAAPIDAVSDDFGPISGTEGGNAGNAFDNDTLNGEPVDASEITATVLTPATPINGGSVPVLDPATGEVTVPAGTPAGSYTIEYQICETLNPTNCDTATVTVEVTAAPIDAVDDSFGMVNGADGGNAGNAFNNDTLNGEPVDASEITATVLTPATPINGGSVPTLDTTTGVVTVPAGTPAGSYTIEYQVCETLNPSNCDTATITVPVGEPLIDAINDDFGQVSGVDGGNAGNAFDNDTLNSDPVDVSEITATVLTPATPINGGSVPVLDPATGEVTVPAGTPAGSYTIEYQICETLNPTNCDTATITVEVTAAPIDAVDDSFPGVDGSTGGDVGNAYDNDTLNGEPVDPSKISGTVLTPATPINGGSVPTLNTTTGVVTVPEGTPAGTYTIEYQICEKTNPDNCDTATITVEVTAAPIDAVDDSFPGVDGSTGGDVGNAYDNDTLNGEPVDPSKISGTVLTPATPINGGSVPTLNTTTGVVTVPEGTPAGTYTIEYQICEKTNPDNCDTATITVEVTAAPIDAVNDDFGPISGTEGGNAGNAFDNDTLNGEPVDASEITATVLTPATPINGGSVPVLDPATGEVTVPAGTPAGSYTIEYQICETLNPTNCDTATITVEVTAAPIDAVSDDFGPISGTEGGNAGNAFDNDTLNGEPVDASEITATVLTPATPINGGSVPVLDPATGEVTVPASTPAGSYTIEYQICETLNPTNCDTATITVEVTAAPIDAVNDDFGPISGTEGGNAGNAFDNDTLNGEPVDPSEITATVLTPATPINGGSVPVLDPATGEVTVPAGTPAGSYTIEYQICETLNPTNCDTATITVEVTAAPIDAVDDSFPDVDGSTGGDVGNAYDNDTLNGEPVDPSKISGTVLTPATPINGGSVPTLDPATGEVTVPAGTPAGSYTIEYQVCETLNPTNCDTATITVEVTAAPIDAVDDDFGQVSGVDGGNAGNAFDNDTLNGEPVDASEITATVLTPATPINGGSVPVLDPATGVVTVPEGTPAGSYTIEYQICETLNPTNCDTATITVEVTAAPIDAVDDSFPDVDGSTGGDVGNAYDNDTLNGEPVDPSKISGTVLTPATPINGGSVPTLDPATGEVTVPAGTPAGSYTIEYQVCETLNPTNCDTATITVEVTAAPIDAVDDDFGQVSGVDGGNAGNAFDNDTLNGEPVDASEITATVLTPATPINGGSVPVLDPATGVVTVPEGTPAGSYTIEYQVCETLNPTNCDTATITVEVTAAPIDAVDDELGPVDGEDGGDAGNAFDNDTLNGEPVDASEITATVLTPATPINGGSVPVLDPATGEVTVPAGTPAGSYTIEYQICETLNPTNCDTATVTLEVTAAPIDAVNDDFGLVNGADGGSVGNAFDNDTLNGEPVDPSEITEVVMTQATPINGGLVPVLDPATGEVTVPAGTPAGSYTIEYQICETLNPSNCDTATVTLEVTAAPIDAVNDDFGPISGTEGGNAGNAFDNDTLNGEPVDASEITATVQTPATPINGGSVPTLDPATGEVTVPAGTPAGSYTIEYQICETLNPSNCDTATVTVEVTAAPIDATGDELGPVNGADGGDAGNAFDNDTLNGEPVDPSEITATVQTPATPINGGSVPVLDPATGEVTVPAGTPAGSYTIEYQICEALNPTNCDTATITVEVTAAPIDAVDDDFGQVNSSEGGSAGNVFGNDTLNGEAVDPSEITATVLTPATPINGGSVPTLDPATGEVTVLAGTPAGSYTIEYQICETLNPTNCDTATVTVEVVAPVIEANDDSGQTTSQNTPITTSVLENDTLNGEPVESEDVEVTVTTPPEEGTVVVNSDGTITYTPPANYSGTVTYTYTICEKVNPDNCDTATVTIEVLPNEVTATDDVVETEAGVPVEISLLDNDTVSSNGAPLDPTSVTVVGQPENGTVACDSAGKCTYTPNSGFAGVDTFTYRVCDTSVPTPVCAVATATITVKSASQLRITKVATPREVNVGDLVRYTVTIENTGDSAVSGFTLIDTPPAGFNYVDGSLSATDTDGESQLTGTYPIRVEQLDVAYGSRATVTYLLRVGAGVGAGSHINRARAEVNGEVVSNEATAEVQLVADPLLEDSLILGTVFDDRDGDGWQDSAKMTGVRVQGGFAPAAYVANSTTVDHGNGPKPEPDASSPMLHGIDIGEVRGRQSEAEPVDATHVVVSQVLNTLDFTDDFVMTTKQGVTLRMDAAGQTRVETQGDAAKGLNAAVPTVERKVSKIESGYRVDYLIGNVGVDERGIPGVRVASVEGLLVETDQFGRYHLVDVNGGRWERGRNFILKVDQATVPPGSEFTTDNPLVRRLTPGLPVRFDFGVKLPKALIEGGDDEIEMQLGEVVFGAGSAEVRKQYLPVVENMAEQVRAHGGGEVVVSANGETQTLAYDRARAVQKALLERLTPEQAQALKVSLRAQPDDPSSNLVTLGATTLLGTVLFDTDKSTIKPEFVPVIEKISADIEKLDGGTVTVVGHADRRGSYNYNDALGLRRAKAVYEAISQRLSPGVRGRLRVEISDNLKAPVGFDGR